MDRRLERSEFHYRKALGRRCHLPSKPSTAPDFFSLSRREHVGKSLLTKEPTTVHFDVAMDQKERRLQVSLSGNNSRSTLMKQVMQEGLNGSPML